MSWGAEQRASDYSPREFASQRDTNHQGTPAGLLAAPCEFCRWMCLAVHQDSAPRMKPETILWIYIVLLVIGGLIGFLKAKSKISLITSVAFAAVLSVCALDYVRIEWAWGILSFLALFFLLRF